MKIKLSLLIAAIAGLTFAFNAGADEKKKDKHDHKHDHKHEKGDGHDHDHGHGEIGPNKGRLIHSVEPHAEFLVTADKKVEIRFLDEKNKTVKPDAFTVSVTTGKRKSPAKLTFVVEGDKLVSEQVLPEGENNPTVVQFRPTAGGKVITEKFNLNLAKHPGTDIAEYAFGEHDHDH